MRSRSTLAGSSFGFCGTSSPRNALATIAASTLVCVRGEIACSFQGIEKIGDFPLENRTRAKCAQHVVERHTGVIVEGMSRRHLFGGERGELPHFDERRGRIIGVISLSHPAELG